MIKILRVVHWNQSQVLLIQGHWNEGEHADREHGMWHTVWARGGEARVGGRT